MPKVGTEFESESKYLKAGDLPKCKKVRVTMDVLERVKMPDGAEKWCLHFRGKDKGLILNKTNALKIASGYGEEMDNWEGNEIFLFSTPVDFQGKTVDAIRVDVPLEEAPSKPAPPPPPADDDEITF